MSAANLEWIDDRFDITKTGVGRDYIGFGPPPGHLIADATDDFDDRVAVIAMKNERTRSRVALGYELNGYRCVTCNPDWFSVSCRSAIVGGSRSFTLVTDDADLMIDVRCREGMDGLPIHAVVDDSTSLGSMPSFIADELEESPAETVD